MIVTIIAAIAERNQGIGFKGSLPWRLKADLAFFRAATMGQAVLMGRKTYESLPGKTLEGRQLLVLSRRGFSAQAVMVFHSLEAALAHAREQLREQQAFIAGGGEIYAQALEQDLVDRMLLTFVHGEFEADVFFPEFNPADWHGEEIAHVQADEFNSHPFTIRKYSQMV